jgi:activator of Hsp90 ATPase-like protein
MNLLFDFTVDKDAKTIFITREFAADLDLVWDAFTKAEILDLWTAPKPWRVRTKEMDFREGGHWLYTMVSQENENSSRYSLVDFIEIHPKTDFSTRNCFADENGSQMGNGFSLVKNSFKPGPEITTVHIEKKFEDLATLEMLVSLGYKEGLAAGLSNLDEYFSALVTSK